MAGQLEYSSTAASNTTLNGIGIAGSNSVKNGDDALRQLMADTASAITKVVDKSGTYTAQKSDFNQMIRATGTLTLNLTAAATLTAGWSLWVKGDGGAVTVDPNGSEQINGAATLSVPDGSSALVICTGSAFRAVVFGDVTLTGTQTLANKTLTAPKISDTSADHQYVIVPSELTANRNVTLPLLTANDEFVFKDFAQTLNNKTIGDATQGSLLSGSIYGLTLSNNGTDATNDIDIATGVAASDDTVPALMVLSAARTKRLDAAWAVGTNQGGLDTGSIANTTYHVWLIRRPDTGVVDALFSASATSPTMPANYTQKRYLGPIVRASSAIRAFRQSGDVFLWGTKITDRTSTSAFSAALLTLSVPTGINVKPIIENVIACNVSSIVATYVGSAAAGGVEMQMTSTFSGSAAGAGSVGNPPPDFETDTSSRLYYQAAVTGGSFSANTLNTLGFVFERGR